MLPVDYELIETPRELVAWCDRMSGCRVIAMDTEFIGDLHYRPVLCWVQVEAEGHLALFDVLSLGNVQPFWEFLVSGDRETIVHGGQWDVRFCYQAVKKMPVGLVDVQIAAGLIGEQYPAGFSTLMERFLGRTFSKAETRTDWQRRPLSNQQIQYALDDVRYLRELWGVLQAHLEQKNRLAWCQEEMGHWKTELIQKNQEEGWRRLRGHQGLSPRGLAILQELWVWREGQAERRNCRPRHVLRDDLLVELARRETANVHRIKAVRGLQNRNVQKHLIQIAACIQRALDLPEDRLPHPTRVFQNQVSPILGQFLYAALATRCQEMEVAPSLVGSPSATRDWIAYRLGLSDRSEIPLLAQGWRAELVGSLLEDLLVGRLGLRILDPTAELPLETVPVLAPSAQT